MKRWLRITGLLILGLLALLAVHGFFLNQSRDLHNKDLADALTRGTQTLQDGLHRRIVVVEDLRAFMLALPELPDAQIFDRYAHLVLSGHMDARAFQYADSTHHIRYVYPLAGNEASLGLDLMQRPAAPYVDRAMRTRKTVLSDPNVTAQGSFSTVVRSPLYDGDEYLGLAQGVFDLGAVLNELSKDLGPVFTYELLDGNGDVFWRQGQMRGDEMEAAVRAGENTWTLRMAWSTVAPAPPRHITLLIWGLGGALLITLLLFVEQAFAHVQTLATAVKERTRELHESVDLLERTFESLSEVVLVVDLETARILRCNHAAQRVFGCKPEELVGENFKQLHVRPEDFDQLASSLRARLPEEEALETETELTRCDGASIRAEISVSTMPAYTESMQAAVCVIRDVTRQRLLEAEGEQLNHSRALILESTEEGIYGIDNHGACTFINRAGAATLGWSPAELIGQDLHELAHHTDASGQPYPREECPILTTLGGGRGCHVEDEFFWRKDGSSFPVQYSSFPIHEHGQIVGAVITFVDMTEPYRHREVREKLEGQLQQAQKMESVGRLAGGVAHDFNNMLSVILGHAQIALTTTPPGDPHHENLQEIMNAGLRSADLTRQLLAFARQQPVTPRVLNLNTAIESILKMLRRLIGEDVSLIWEPGQTLQSVKLDPAQIDQILTNLVVNARDAITSGGRITIATTNTHFDEDYCALHRDASPGPHVVLSVSDNGAGMDKHTLAHVFEPFFTTKEQGKGTGLGLATVYGIVTQNAGTISVYSEPGRGTTFNLFFPAHDSVLNNAGEAAPESPPGTGSETILLVEDEEALLALTQRMLNKLGYAVLSAPNPERALAEAENTGQPIDLLLTDVIMPGMNGNDLWRQLHARHPGLKCIFMSGYSADIIAEQGILEPGIHYLQKPFGLAALAAELREVLDAD